MAQSEPSSVWRMLWCVVGMRDLFSQLPGVAGSCKLPIFPGNCPSWRKQPCSRSCHLSGWEVAHIQWLAQVLAQPHSGSAEVPPWFLSAPVVTEVFTEFASQLGFPFLLPFLGVAPKNTLPPISWHVNLHHRVCFFSYETYDKWFVPSKLEILFRKGEL